MPGTWPAPGYWRRPASGRRHDECGGQLGTGLSRWRRRSAGMTMLEAVRRIAVRVSVPVTADMVAGFGPTPEDVAETVRGVIAAGAVGLNLEDSTGDTHNPLVEISLQVDKILAAPSSRDDGGRSGRHQRPHRRLPGRGRRCGHAARSRSTPRQRLPRGGCRLPLRSRRPGFRDDCPTGPVDHRPA